MNRCFLAFLAICSLAMSNPCAAQTADKSQKSLVPPGVIADRNALTPMDYIEIQQLYARYALSLDMGDGAARAKTFTTGGYYSNLPSGHKPVYVDELVKRTNATGNNGERHLVNNIIITPTKEGADGFAYLTMISRDGKGPYRVLQRQAGEDARRVALRRPGGLVRHRPGLALPVSRQGRRQGAGQNQLAAR